MHFTRAAPHGIAIHNIDGANRAAHIGEAEVHAAFAVACSIQHDYMDNNGWSGKGQRFTVSRGGVILEGRHGSLTGAKSALVVRGAHAGSDEGSRRWFGIEIEGKNMDGFHVLPTQ